VRRELGILRQYVSGKDRELKSGKLVLAGCKKGNEECRVRTFPEKNASVGYIVHLGGMK